MMIFIPVIEPQTIKYYGHKDYEGLILEIINSNSWSLGAQERGLKLCGFKEKDYYGNYYQHRSKSDNITCSKNGKTNYCRLTVLSYNGEYNFEGGIPYCYWSVLKRILCSNYNFLN